MLQHTSSEVIIIQLQINLNLKKQQQLYGLRTSYANYFTWLDTVKFQCINANGTLEWNC